MRFPITGARFGRPVELAWEDGRLESGPAGMFELEGYLEARQPVSATPTGRALPPRSSGRTWPW